MGGFPHTNWLPCFFSFFFSFNSFIKHHDRNVIFTLHKNLDLTLSLGLFIFILSPILKPVSVLSRITAILGISTQGVKIAQ